MSLPTLSQLEIGLAASVSPSTGVPTSSLHQASSSKSHQLPVDPIMKEVAPGHTSPQVFALGSDLEEGEISSEVSSQSSEPSVLVSDDGLQNQHLSLSDFVGDMGKV